MLLRSCLIDVSIIILRYFLYLLSVCPCLGLGLFVSYLCDLFFIFIFIFIMINSIISWVQTGLFFCLFFRICLLFLHDNVDEECKYFSNRDLLQGFTIGFCLAWLDVQPVSVWRCL